MCSAMRLSGASLKKRYYYYYYLLLISTFDVQYYEIFEAGLGPRDHASSFKIFIARAMAVLIFNNTTIGLPRTEVGSPYDISLDSTHGRTHSTQSSQCS